MNVADKDLCAELYELSGWDDVSFWHELLKGKGYITTFYQPTPITNEQIWSGNKFIPAYDAGFLLRKLPKFVKNADFWLNYDGLDTAGCTAGYMTESINGGHIWTVSEIANNPENALCSLAIELFKSGILQKEAV
jgi:hypothetical protein